MKLRLAITIVALIVLLLIVPPYISVSRYRSRITQLISASLGRPVRLASVQIRLLPRPSFLLSDLAVEEDPAFGAEPVLHASSVRAAIRLSSLWRGELRIDRISVDEASLNLVRNASGGWNLDALVHTPGAPSSGVAERGRAIPFPYLEATNSRINIKNGAEKLPYSLVNADLSFWGEGSGDWHVRLRGQPARTDVNVNLADTGVVRLEATLRHADQRRDMPLHVDLDWRQAQLGQLTRLMLGSDEGWRGDMTGEVHVDGTTEAARIKARLRATGVHRAEFTPASPMDFDATCSLGYRPAKGGIDGLLCESPVGDGRARFTVARHEDGQTPHYAVELDRVPAQMGLDALRTIRKGIDTGLEAAGSLSGRLDYTVLPATAPPKPEPHGRHPRNRTPDPGPLTGTLTLSGLRLSGGRLAQPVQVAKGTIDAVSGTPAALLATLAIPAGGPTPLNATVRLDLHGYSADARGLASFAALQQFASVAGGQVVHALDKLSGPAATVDLQAEGPWVVENGATVNLPDRPARPSATLSLIDPGAADLAKATLTVHNATWKPEFLANPVEIVSGTLHADATGINWSPVAFTYGPVHGSGSVIVTSRCDDGPACPPKFAAHFEELDVAELQAAILGAQKPGTLLSGLLDRLRPASANNWPTLEGSVQANSLVLGPVTLSDTHAAVRLDQTGASIDHLAAQLLGGQVNGSGSVKPSGKPVYSFQGSFNGLHPSDVGRLLGMTWSGDSFDGIAKIEASGFTDREVAASAKGTIHFDWTRGAVAMPEAQDRAQENEVPADLTRFDRWTADGDIAENRIALKGNQVITGGHTATIEASAEFGDPPHVTFGTPTQARIGDH